LIPPPYIGQILVAVAVACVVVVALVDANRQKHVSLTSLSQQAGPAYLNKQDQPISTSRTSLSQQAGPAYLNKQDQPISTSRFQV
jgi:hypothetical protein